MNTLIVIGLILLLIILLFAPAIWGYLYYTVKIFLKRTRKTD